MVIDDGSTDETAAVATRHGARVLSQPNRGPAAARNLGAREASGETLVFLDADCRVAPGWLSALLAPLADPTLDAVKGAYLTDQSAPVARLCQVEFEERYRLLRARPTTDFVDSFSMAIRRSVFLEAGGFDETFRVADNEDVDLSYRLATRGRRIAFAPDARVSHRHPDSLRRYARLKLSRGFHRMRVYERYPGKALRDSYTPLSLKIQVAGALALTFLFPSTLLAMAASAPLLAVACALLGGSVIVSMSLSAIPFLARTAKTNISLLPWAIPFLAVRSFSLGMGVARRLARRAAPLPKSAQA